MKRPKRTLAIVAFTTLVSCSTALPATTPTSETIVLRIYATTAAVPLVNDLAGAYRRSHAGIEFDIQTGNYQSLIERLLNGEMSYFVSSHLPIESQAALKLWAAPIAQDGIAIVVHAAVSVEGLTTAQLRDIYQGRVSNWNSVGGPDQEIVVISREEGSGTRAEFEQLVMGVRRTTRAARVAPSSAAVLASVAEIPGSIGYISTSYLEAGVRALAIDGVVPTLENIAGNTYPLRSTVFVVGLAEPEADYRAFIGWVQSPAGQSVAARRFAPLLTAP